MTTSRRFAVAGDIASQLPTETGRGAHRTSILASFAVVLALLAGAGFGRDVSVASAGPAAVGIVAAIDVPAPSSVGTVDGIRRGGQAARIEVDDADLSAALSAWYRLAYIDGGTRLQVFEHSAAGTLGPGSDIARSARTAWRMASLVVGGESQSTTSLQVPDWARVRTGNTDGPSAGLIFTLAYIDLLTPGALVGNLRVAGTGGIATNGAVFKVSGIEVKVAAAMLTRPDVVFTPRPSTLTEHSQIVESELTPTPTDGDSVGDWLDVIGYEQAGRNAADDDGTVAFVVVHDFRQALAWLCGRTGSATTCAIAHRSASIRIETP
jgi:hypothetical protein